MEYLSSHSFWVYLAGFCRSACEVRPVPASSLYYVCAFLMKFQSNPKIRDPDYAVPISLPFLLWRVTAQFPLACMSTGMWAYILLLGGRRCKTEYLLFLWGIGRTAANILWSHHCNPPPFLNAALWNTFLPFAAVVQLQGVWDKMKEYPKPGMGLLIFPAEMPQHWPHWLAGGEVLCFWAGNVLMAAAAALLCSSAWNLMNCFPRYVGKSRSQFSKALEWVHNL